MALHTQVIGLGFVNNLAQYQASPAAHLYAIPQQDFHGGVKDIGTGLSAGPGGGTYSMARAGTYAGASAKKAGWIGEAHYLAESGTITTKTNEVITDTSGTKRTVCITTTAGGGDAACTGADRTFSAGAYKFSLMGYTGTDYSEPAKIGGAAWTHIGFRQELKPEGLNVSLKLKPVGGAETVIASDADIDALRGQDIEKITVICEGGSKLGDDAKLPYGHVPSPYQTERAGRNTGPVSARFKFCTSHLDSGTFYIWYPEFICI